MRLNCVNSWDAHLVGATKVREDYTWRLTGNVTEEHTSYTWNVAMNLNFTRPHPGMVLWIRIGGVKHMCRNVPADSWDAHLVGATKMREDYTWRLTGNVTEEHTSYTWNVTMNLNFTCPHPGMVLWISIGGVKCMCQNVPADHLMGPYFPS